MSDGRRVLITGGFGFLGAYLADALLRREFDVTLFDNAAWSTTPACALGLEQSPRLNRIHGSVMQEVALSDAGAFDYIIHAAGILGIKRVEEQPILTMDVNILGTRAMLDFAARQPALKRFVHLSTSETYGPFADEVAEDAPAVVPSDGMRWCYAASKVATEHFVKAFAFEKQFPSVIVRPFNVYGPYRTGSNAMTTLVRNAITGKQLVISGTAKQTRSWCHVKDFVRGVIACLDVEQARDQCFNLGNNSNNISMLDLAEMIRRMAGSKSEIVVDGNEGSDVQFRKPNIEKARRLLNYNPSIDLPAGINDVISWSRAATSVPLS